MKTAIVTGGSRGIGAAYVRKLGEMGYSVAINYYARDSELDAEHEAVQALIKELDETYHVCGIAVPADISTVEGCNTLSKAALESFDEKIDVLVNNAGISNDRSLFDLTYEQYMRTFQTNFIGAFHMCHKIVPYMARRGCGCVVSTSSVGGLMGFPNGSDYCASKAALIGMTRALAIEFAARNIRFNCICPGMVWTDMLRNVPKELNDRNAKLIPMGKIGHTEDIALALEFIIKNQYLTGQSISPNGGIVMP